MADHELTPELARQLFAPRALDEQPPEPPEPEVEGLPPSDKPVSEWTDEERAAFHADHEQRLRERGRAEAQEQREAEERRGAEANKTDEQRLGDTISAMLAPGAKETANRTLVESLHDLEGAEGDQS
jgi:hypothetical protein